MGQNVENKFDIHEAWGKVLIDLFRMLLILITLKYEHFCESLWII